MINRYSYTDRYLQIHAYTLSVSTTMMLFVWDWAGLEWRWSGAAWVAWLSTATIM